MTSFNEVLRAKFSLLPDGHGTLLDEVGLSSMEYYDLEHSTDEWSSATPLRPLARLCARLAIDLTQFAVCELPSSAQSFESVVDLKRSCTDSLATRRGMIDHTLESAGVLESAADEFCSDPLDYAERVPLDGVLPVLSAFNVDFASFLRLISR